MWKKILIGVDNSLHSLWATDLAVMLGKVSEGASVTGCHVYAVKLHDSRFKAMEYTLPKKYLKDDVLEKQREVHNDLIGKGMEVISDSYMDVVKKKCADGGVEFSGVSLEGKNYKRLVEEAGAGDYDILLLGALGVGATEKSRIGSVAMRSARMLEKDVFIVRNERLPQAGDKIVVCMDGSPQAYAGLDAAIELARTFDLSIHIVAVYDPYFHRVIFTSVSKVLSEEGAKVFRFKEQEELHDGIIDDGLGKIYDSYLKVATGIVEKNGLKCEAHLLSGKAFDEILAFVEREEPWLLVGGRVGSHVTEGTDIGATAENLLLNSPANFLLTSREVAPPIEEVIMETMKWTEEAEGLIGKAPSFVRGIARKAIEKYSKEAGHSVVTSDVIEAAMKKLMPGQLDKFMKHRKDG